MELEFDEKVVIAKYMETITSIKKSA
jgi:hypothetical protein